MSKKNELSLDDEDFRSHLEAELDDVKKVGTGPADTRRLRSFAKRIAELSVDESVDEYKKLKDFKSTFSRKERMFLNNMMEKVIRKTINNRERIKAADNKRWKEIKESKIIPLNDETTPT